MIKIDKGILSPLPAEPDLLQNDNKYMSKQFAVYILTNKTHAVLYTGITSDLIKRIFQHKDKQVSGFTKKYNVDKLVYYESYEDAQEAIKREKQIKNLVRRKKIKIINRMNPDWKDVYDSLI